MKKLDSQYETPVANGAAAAAAIGRDTRRLQLPVDPERAGSTGAGGARGSSAERARAGPPSAKGLAEGAGKPSPAKIMGARIGGLVLGILIAALVAFAGLAMIWFDISGSKQKVVRLLKLDQTSWVLLEERRAGIDKATSELATQKRQVEEERLKNEVAATALQKRERDLEQRLARLEEQTRLLSTQTLSLQSLKSVYETMDPAKAAAMVMAAKDREQTAIILKSIGQARLSQILEQMAPAIASEYMALMTPDLAAIPTLAVSTAAPANGSKTTPATTATPAKGTTAKP